MIWWYVYHFAVGTDLMVIETKPSVLDEVDMNSIKWTQTLPRSSDQLMGENMVLSSPCERGWHSCTLMCNDKLLVVFGGYRYK